MRRRRLTLTRRQDGRRYLERWGVETKYGGLYVHKITAPDPGTDVHDHPWFFVSVIMRGGYTELVKEIRVGGVNCGYYRNWKRWSVHTLRLDQAHRITDVDAGTWTLVLRGPRVRNWGFFTPAGYVPHTEYKQSRRDLEEK